jgi:hypothetical protein
MSFFGLCFSGAGKRTKLPGAQHLKVMKGLITAFVFVYLDPVNPEGDHPVCGEGKTQLTAVNINNAVQRQSAGNFLDNPLRENDKVIVRKHGKIITRLLRLRQGIAPETVQRI